MAQAVYGSMYYILSSTRHDWPYGLSPGGLPAGEEYMGHTFWDQDIWMYPPLVLLHPDLARSSLKYRKDRLPAARRIAKEYGYKGNGASVSRDYPYHLASVCKHFPLNIDCREPDSFEHGSRTLSSSFIPKFSRTQQFPKIPTAGPEESRS